MTPFNGFYGRQTINLYFTIYIKSFLLGLHTQSNIHGHCCPYMGKTGVLNWVCVIVCGRYTNDSGATCIIFCYLEFNYVVC